MQRMLIHPTLRVQSWGFVIGSTLFALGSAPYLSSLFGATLVNLLFFVGSWFFTAAAIVQLALAGPVIITDSGRPAVRVVWLSAAVQLLGTIMFNISTGSAMRTLNVRGEINLVWNPDAEGSIAFLASSFLAILMLWRSNTRWASRSADWQSVWLNALGSIAFGVSAVGSFILKDGNTLDPNVANIGTFVGALFFLFASAVFLGRSRPSALVAEPA